MKASRAARLTMRTLARLRLDTTKLLDTMPPSISRMLVETQLTTLDVAGEVIADAHGSTWRTIIERERAAELRLRKGPKSTVTSNALTFSAADAIHGAGGRDE